MDELVDCGVKVGFDDGEVVGFDVVGLTVGDIVTVNAVGRSVGASVGSNVKSIVLEIGGGVGEVVGSDIGEVVGFNVGDNVGPSVRSIGKGFVVREISEAVAHETTADNHRCRNCRGGEKSVEAARAAEKNPAPHEPAPADRQGLLLQGQA